METFGFFSRGMIIRTKNGWSRGGLRSGTYFCLVVVYKNFILGYKSGRSPKFLLQTRATFSVLDEVMIQDDEIMKDLKLVKPTKGRSSVA